MKFLTSTFEKSKITLKDKFIIEHKKNFEKKVLFNNFYSKFLITESYFDDKTISVKRFISNNTNSFVLSNFQKKKEKNIYIKNKKSNFILIYIDIK
jgi:hypothetical protein